ncbi:molecular chaperone [Serratia fonticola]|uniref:fimbrial biogenesis chaperone n=1 Tax=Serratia fonticola TaxID=47917 RepID=UPI0013789DE0|nr:molecular chaperone [Serratia fonticola]NCG54961.1 fimbria/pilus periplasmic chaperone [Serratia fonticola]
MSSAYASFITLLLVVFSTLSAHAAANGGVSLSQTRVVFSAEDKAQTVTVKNTGTQNYLIQSRVQRDVRHVGTAPFVVTPPLFALGPERKQLLRILRQGEALPTDRESLFYLSVSAIPAQSEPAPEAARLSMGFQFVIKLFYRPVGLKDTPEAAPCRLQFTPTVKGVRIENPTSYFLTLGALTFDQRVIDLDKQPSMVAPMGMAFYPASQPVRQVHWQTITDVGGLSAECQHALPSLQEPQK